MIINVLVEEVVNNRYLRDTQAYRMSLRGDIFHSVVDGSIREVDANDI